MDKTLPKDKTSGKPGETNAPKMTVLGSSGIIGCTFHMPSQEDGQKFWVRMVKMVDYLKKKLSQDPGHTQFICSVDYDQFGEIM